jgi:hypothetical protein
MKRIILIPAVLAVIAAGSAGAAPRAAAPQSFSVSFLTIGGADKPVYVVARGPINAVGTATQTEKDDHGVAVNYAVLHFAGGSVALTAREPRFGFKMNPRTCSGPAYGGGTWTITGGTGAYAGATGHGEFSTGGTAIAQRSRAGVCRGEKTPPAETVFYVTITMRGTAAAAHG